MIRYSMLCHIPSSAMDLQPSSSQLAARYSAHPLQNCYDYVHCVSGTCPAYFHDVCHPAASVAVCARPCSTDHGDLVNHRTNSKWCGLRSFCIAAAAIWNKLPPHLRTEDVSREQFARGLKTCVCTCLLIRGASMNIGLRDADKWTDWLNCVGDYNGVLTTASAK